MKTKIIILSFVISLSYGCRPAMSERSPMIENGFRLAEQQLSRQSERIPNCDRFPRTIKDGELYTTRMTDWTEGFFPGCLWYAYEYNKEESWKQAAIRWTDPLEPLKELTGQHDIGFLIYCSFGNAYRLTGDSRYRNILIEAAESLASRFDEKTGCIKSWNYKKSWNGKDEWLFPVIINNMMNLELLYFVSKETGDPKYAAIADSHAETTLRNQFRADYGCYHVVNYNPEDGTVLHKATYQGFADNSVWARGQAYAIYGYTMAYRETKRKEYLRTAMHAADFWLSHPNLPTDGIPYWDFNAGEEGYIPNWNYDPQRFKSVPRDASAAAIAASAFLELSAYAPEGERYFKAAERILQSLSSPAYLAQPGTNGYFLLKHCVGNLPNNEEVDVPLVYADYYYLEALLRYKKYKN